MLDILYFLAEHRVVIANTIRRDFLLYISVAAGVIIIGPLILWIALVTGSDVAALLALIALGGLAGLCT